MENETINVLLIDDDVEFTQLVHLMLARARMGEFRLDSVEKLSEGVKLLEKGNFDIVLLDLSLPDTFGLDTFMGLNMMFPEIPVVLMTGFDDLEWALQAVRAGAQDYLIKGRADGDRLIRSIFYAIERHRLWKVLHSLSFIDDLTGLYNRRGFLTLAEQQLKLSYRNKRNFSIIFGDLDGLKKINDSFGHKEGDRALVGMAKVLRRTFRKTDVIARVGGDEFIVMAIDAKGHSHEVIMDRLRKNIKDYNSSNGVHHIDISLGTARFDPKNEVTIEELIQIADKNQYEHKRSKKP